MKKSMENQKENVQELLRLIQENPDLRIIPMVYTECVGDDCHCSWASSWGKARIDEVWFSDEKIYALSLDFDELVEDEYERLLPENCTDEAYKEKIEKQAEENVNAYDWEKVILVDIDPY